MAEALSRLIPNADCRVILVIRHRQGATGIGAFLDEEANRYLGLSSELGQVVYHFAIGYPVSDPRLEA